MQNKVYHLFAILHGKNPLTRVPIQIFTSKDYENAKLYFQGYLYGENNQQDYMLYKIGEFDNKLKLKESKCFICGGYEITRKQNNEFKKIKQLKLETEKQIEAEKEKDTTEALKILFGD